MIGVIGIRNGIGTMLFTMADMAYCDWSVVNLVEVILFQSQWIMLGVVVKCCVHSITI